MGWGGGLLPWQLFSAAATPEILVSAKPPKGENSPACVPDTRALESSEVIILEGKK